MEVSLRASKVAAINWLVVGRFRYWLFMAEYSWSSVVKFNPFAPNGRICPSNVPFYKLNINWIFSSYILHLKISSYSTDILLPVLIWYAYWDKMSRFSIKCVHCRVVALSCCWDMTSHLWLTFVSPSSRYFHEVLSAHCYRWRVLQS